MNIKLEVFKQYVIIFINLWKIEIIKKYRLHKINTQIDMFLYFVLHMFVCACIHSTTDFGILSIVSEWLFTPEPFGLARLLGRRIDKRINVKLT